MAFRACVGTRGDRRKPGEGRIEAYQSGAFAEWQAEAGAYQLQWLAEIVVGARLDARVEVVAHDGQAERIHVDARCD